MKVSVLQVDRCKPILGLNALDHAPVRQHLERELVQSPVQDSSQFHWRFLLVRDVRGFQVNPLCRHDITRSDRQIGNQGYIRNLGRFGCTYDYLIDNITLVLFPPCILSHTHTLGYNLTFQKRVSSIETHQTAPAAKGFMSG